MKIMLSLVSIAAFLGAAELIHISNETDSKTVDNLLLKYKKEIIISDSRAYLVPSECLLVRHFGGLSQGNLSIVGKELHNGYLSMTQEVFEAKDAAAVKEEIEKRKISDTIEAKGAKAFLDESDGHLFGGLSQGKVDLQEQKQLVATAPKTNKETEQKATNPSCKLLEDGSGYMIFGTKNAKIYSKDGFKILHERILFH
ncbi:MAG: hypothetical protein PHX44_08400 [Sulfurimonas sp.]|uniref:hypothetical protein n=1 Tax=Sulfurimonas sp. TaxID=2022749 RepID=UPI00261307C1|nr:hypothetical protein [Sulfurimonas sp.]MDD2653053.1 hypothetical protein [Sulfurimonas sp.]MDD3452254.1 hypothetical protein [Sulfurimonas sp.]